MKRRTILFGCLLVSSVMALVALAGAKASKQATAEESYVVIGEASVAEFSEDRGPGNFVGKKLLSTDMTANEEDYLAYSKNSEDEWWLEFKNPTRCLIHSIEVPKCIFKFDKCSVTAQARYKSTTNYFKIGETLTLGKSHDAFTIDGFSDAGEFYESIKLKFNSPSDYHPGAYYGFLSSGSFVVKGIASNEVILDHNGGTSDSDATYVIPGYSYADVDVPTKEHYTFLGYYDDIESGIKIYDADGTPTGIETEADTLYAHWELTGTAITFDAQGGNLGTPGVQAYYDQELPEILAPTKEDYVFQGYYAEEDGEGTQYYDALGKGVLNWDQWDENVTLYADWVKASVARVISLIQDIGTVEYTSSCKAKIDAAEEAYEELGDEDKPEVSNFNLLVDAKARYEKLKGDNEAADSVDALIESIGEVVYSEECKNRIDEARNAYEALEDDQQALVEKLDVLVLAEARYEKLKADAVTASGVDALISAIGEVSYTPECKARIEAARTMYDVLSEEQKALVSNIDDLLAAEAKYEALKQDKQEAEEVDALIENIGEVVYSEECKNRIDDAREAYEALEEDQKPFVDKLDALLAAEARYEKLKADNEAADLVDALIENIGTIDYSEECKSRIDDARQAYEDLDEDQQALVEKLDVLVEAEARYEELKADNEAADHVDSLIESIGAIDYSEECKKKIDEARQAYEDLDEDQQALVEKLDALVSAETLYKELKADNEAADSVDALIENIGAIDYSEDCKNRIDDARQAYDDLDESQQALVEKLDALVEAERDYAKAHENRQKAIEVEALIDSIGEVEYTIQCKAKLDDARQAYDELSLEQKAYVLNLDKLTSAVEEFERLSEAAKTSISNGGDASVEFGDGSGFHDNVSLSMKVVSSSDEIKASTHYDAISKAIGNGERVVSLYDLKLLMSVDGVSSEVQPNELKPNAKLKVRLALPEGTTPDGLRVLHIHEDGRIEEIEEIAIGKGRIAFEVTSFSEFAIVNRIVRNTLPPYAYIAIGAGSLLLVILLAHLILFSMFNKWIIKEGKPVRVIVLSVKYGQAHVMMRSFQKEYLPAKDVFKKKPKIDDKALKVEGEK